MNNELQNSSLFHNRYTIVKLLGQGGMGRVYLAQDNMLDGQYVALKVLSADYVKNEKSKQRFMREVLLARKVNHENVLRTHDLGESEQGLYLSMEYVEGQSLKDYLRTYQIGLGVGLRLASEITKGLKAIHDAGIVHRDLKSSNVLVTKSGQIKILDFGIASPGDSELTQTHELLGSAQYMAPELWSGQMASVSTDLYALGVIFYELFCGMLPFEGMTGAELMYKHMKVAPTPPLDIVEHLSLEVNNLLLDLLAKQPSIRPESCMQVIESLEHIILNPYASGFYGNHDDEIEAEEPNFVADEDYEGPNQTTPQSAFDSHVQEPVIESKPVEKRSPQPFKVLAFSLFACLFVMGLLLYLTPYVNALLAKQQAALNPGLLHVLLGVGLNILPLSALMLQFLFLKALCKVNGQSVSAQSIVRPILIVSLLAVVLALYYFALFVLELGSFREVLVPKFLLANAYEVLEITAFTMSEIALWQIIPKGFAVAGSTGNLNLESTAIWYYRLLPCAASLLVVFAFIRGLLPQRVFAPNFKIRLTIFSVAVFAVTLTAAFVSSPHVVSLVLNSQRVSEISLISLISGGLVLLGLTSLAFVKSKR